MLPAWEKCVHQRTPKTLAASLHGRPPTRCPKFAYLKVYWATILLRRSERLCAVMPGISGSSLRIGLYTVRPDR